MHITIHNYDIETIKENRERSEDRFMPIHKTKFSDDLDLLQSLADDCMILTAYYSVHEKNPKKAAKYFLLDQRAMKWYFRLALEPAGTITRIHLDEEWVFNIEAFPTNDYVNCGSWEVTLYAAIIARDKEAIEWLLEFPEKRMHEATSQGPEYTYIYVDFLKAYFTNSPAAE